MHRVLPKCTYHCSSRLRTQDHGRVRLYTEYDPPVSAPERGECDQQRTARFCMHCRASFKAHPARDVVRLGFGVLGTQR